MVVPALHYTPLERLSVRRPVDRIGYIAAACAHHKVLDLGAMDETAWQAKRGRGSWLHEEISRTALSVEGIDSSSLIPEEGLRTAANSIIRRGDVGDPQRVLGALAETPDIVVAGELIEHLENSLEFLRRLAGTQRLAGKSLILSTPNATALHNVLIGLARRESTHHDHLAILSYKTLTTLCMRAGFRNWEIIPYYARFTEMRDRHSGMVGLAIRGAELLINALEWCFPLLSAGYILRIDL